MLIDMLQSWSKPNTSLMSPGDNTQMTSVILTPLRSAKELTTAKLV